MPDHIRAEGWDDAIPSGTYVNPRGGWTVNLFLKNKEGKPLACRAGYAYTWKVSPRGTKQATLYKKRPCRFAVKVPREGVYTVTVEERNAKTGTFAAPGAKDVTVQDFLIAGVGDSNGSGQANPPYWNRQCDRSAESYQMKAAELVEQRRPADVGDLRPPRLLGCAHGAPDDGAVRRAGGRPGQPAAAAARRPAHGPPAGQVDAGDRRDHHVGRDQRPSLRRHRGDVCRERA